MKDDIGALKQALDEASLEEQKTILERFMVESTDESILESIRIANESFIITDQGYFVSSHVKD